MLGIVFLVLACLIGLAIYWLAVRGEWSQVGAMVAALIPVAMTYFLGVIGVLIGGALLAAVWKATA